MDGIAIEPATDADLPLLPPLEMRAGERFRAVGLDDVADGPPLPLDALRRAHAAGGVWVARAPDGAPVGFAVVEPVDDGLHLEELSVEPAWGGRGIGSALLDRVVALAAERGLRAVTLGTFGDVPWNAPFYARRGFVVVPPAAQGPGLRAMAEAEAARGLGAERRVVMRRAVRGLSPAGRG